jgi:hypothetical protein
MVGVVIKAQAIATASAAGRFFLLSTFDAETGDWGTGIMSIEDISRLIRALDTIEEVTHALGYSMENSAIKERHASGFLLELHEYLSGQRSNLLDFLGETTGATPEEEVIRLSAVVQYQAWCREFRKETLRELNASALATEATG